MPCGELHGLYDEFVLDVLSLDGSQMSKLALHDLACFLLLYDKPHEDEDHYQSCHQQHEIGKVAMKECISRCVAKNIHTTSILYFSLLDYKVRNIFL